MITSPALRFHSSAFRVRPGEDQDTNPGTFGESLALWLGKTLVGPDFDTEQLVPEDFGWCVPISKESGTAYVACANVGDSTTQWQCYVFASEGLLKRTERQSCVREIYDALREAIESTSGVSDLHEEELVGR